MINIGHFQKFKVPLLMYWNNEVSAIVSDQLSLMLYFGINSVRILQFHDFRSFN